MIHYKWDGSGIEPSSIPHWKLMGRRNKINSVRQVAIKGFTFVQPYKMRNRRNVWITSELPFLPIEIFCWGEPLTLLVIATQTGMRVFRCFKHETLNLWILTRELDILKTDCPQLNIWLQSNNPKKTEIVKIKN